MKRLIFISLIFLYPEVIMSQQQQHIPWPSLADSPWPNSRGDAQATGRSKFVGPRTPNVHWRKDMPLGILNGPVIGYNNELFVGTRAANTSGAGVNYFYSMDKNGNNIWTYNTHGWRANLAGPTIGNDGTIYFQSLGSGAAGSGGLYALNPDGSFKWNNTKFLALGSTRFVSIAKNFNLIVAGFDTLYLVESQNGIVLDSVQVPNLAEDNIVFSTAGDTIYFFTGRLGTEDPQRLNAYSVNGEHLWSVDSHLGSHNQGVPLVDNSNRIYIYAAEPGLKGLYNFNPDGTLNWQYQLDSNEIYSNHSSPTIDANGNIILSSAKFFEPAFSDSGYITSLDYSGNVNWQTNIGHYWDDGAFINSGLVCDAEGKIYCGSSLGANTNFWCLDSNGTILWKLDLEGYEYDTSPAINSEGTLYIGTHFASLYQEHQRNLIAINDNPVSVEDDYEEMTFRLYQNFPNPFNPETHIDFMLMESSNVRLTVYNVLGQEVKKIVNEEMIPGYYSRIFDGRDLPSGIYFYELVKDKVRITKKMILLR
ncbi:MAG: PQQ-binding-like beta-propeller repeat protein [Ignavibacteriaceae bacterium]